MGLLARISWLEALDVIEAEVDGADFQAGSGWLPGWLSRSLVDDDGDLGAPRKAIVAIARLERAARDCPPLHGSPGLPTSTPGRCHCLFYPPQALSQPAGDETPIHEESEDEESKDEHYDNGPMNMCHGHHVYDSVMPCKGADNRWRWGAR